MRAPAACAWILDFVPSRFLADDTHQKLVPSVPACACGCPPGDARRPKKRRHRTPVPASFLALRSSCHEPSNTHAGAKPDQAGLQAPTRTCRPRHMKNNKIKTCRGLLRQQVRRAAAYSIPSSLSTSQSAIARRVPPSSLAWAAGLPESEMDRRGHRHSLGPRLENTSCPATRRPSFLLLPLFLLVIAFFRARSSPW
jgi:hypothetical protein